MYEDLKSAMRHASNSVQNGAYKQAGYCEMMYKENVLPLICDVLRKSDTIDVVVCAQLGYYPLRVHHLIVLEHYTSENWLCHSFNIL